MMAVYVDPLRDYGKKIGRLGPWWCHMMADSEAELHEMAGSIGLKQSWYQGDHYDLTPGKRALAVQRGAIQQDGMEWIRTVVRLRRAWRPRAGQS